jgi:hypothetical protein
MSEGAVNTKRARQESYGLCDCNWDKCDKTKTYCERTRRKHRQKTAELQSNSEHRQVPEPSRGVGLCNCGGPKCVVGHFYSQRQIQNHYANLDLGAEGEAEDYANLIEVSEEKLISRDVCVATAPPRAPVALPPLDSETDSDTDTRMAEEAAEEKSSSRDVSVETDPRHASSAAPSLDSDTVTDTDTLMAVETDPSLSNADIVDSHNANHFKNPPEAAEEKSSSRDPAVETDTDPDNLQDTDTETVADLDSGTDTDTQANQHGSYPQMEEDAEAEADPHNPDPENYDHLNVFEGPDAEHVFERSEAPEDKEDEDADDMDWETPLGPGLSKLLLVTLLFAFQSRFKVNNTAMRVLFRIIKLVLVAADNTTQFPSFDKSKTKFAPPEKCKVRIQHVCPDCEWLYGEVDAAEVCPYCKADRYMMRNGKKAPRKKYFRWSLIELLKMRTTWKTFMNKLDPVPAAAHENNAPNLVSSKVISPDLRKTLYHYTTLGAYVFILALACDGFNPWRGVQYTMWFFALRILNLKVSHSASTNDVITIGITCGPREPKTLQFYANSIVEELLLLQANNVTVPRYLPESLETVFVPMLAVLVALVGDYPALCKMLVVQGVGKFTHNHTQHNAGYAVIFVFVCVFYSCKVWMHQVLGIGRKI